MRASFSREEPMSSASAQSLSPSRPSGQSAVDPCALSATELAVQIAQGAITAREAVEAHIARIECVNAVVYKRYDDARAEADMIDQRRISGDAPPPLAGVPVTVKECLDLKGTASTFGVPGRAAARAMADDPYVARLRAAGAIVIAKTNVAQLLIFTETDNPLYGRTNNPWNPERSSGGSSGGEARLSLPAAPLWDWAPTSAAACGSPPPSAGFRRCVRPPDAVPISAAPAFPPASAPSPARSARWPAASMISRSRFPSSMAATASIMRRWFRSQTIAMSTSSVSASRCWLMTAR
jgi:hypothetical protein